MRSNRLAIALVAVAVAATAAACSDSGSTTAPSSTPASTPTATSTTAPDAPVDGGTLKAGIADSPDHLDTGLSYTNQGWEILLATNNGLLTYKKSDGPDGSVLVPDLATAMPVVSADGLTYTFTMRPGVMFSPPVSREVLPSDEKASIERLFRIDSPGTGFYTVIKGAEAYGKSRQGGIAGIVADDAKRTITFTLTHPDGTFLNYLSLAFAFVYPAGTPDKDVSTVDAARVATGPYMISGYTPKRSITVVRNPNFKVWTPDTPKGHLDGIDVEIGVDPERAANMTAAGQLDFSFEPIAPDRFTELTAKYPDQVANFVRNNITYFSMNERKSPFDKLAVRQAVNYAIDRKALVKVFGGQGQPTENILPPGLGASYVKHDFYPIDVAKAKALVQQAGATGAAVTVFSHNTDPAPKAAQYVASVLNDIGLKASVKLLDESVYWDTISTQKGDPQIAFNDWNQDFPEGQDFIDVLLNGEGIVDVGNNNASNTNVPELNALIDKAKAMPVGPERDAAWAELDHRFMTEDAGWAPFMNRTFPKFWSARLHGVVFNTSYYELFTSMWLAP
jgi:peptide/nickel transport system substrate-binding protein